VRSFFAGRPRGNPERGRSFPRVAMDFSLFMDGKKTDTVHLTVFDAFGQPRIVSFSKIKRQLVRSLCDSRFATWKELERNLDFLTGQLRERFPDSDVLIKKELYLNGKKVSSYLVENDNYFMMGDNRDDSMDSRYWGYVNRNFVKAKAFILYFSLDSRTSWWLLPLKIRWKRMGKLIRSWNGLDPPDYYR
jgi:hypothetical protein